MPEINSLENILTNVSELSYFGALETGCNGAQATEFSEISTVNCLEMLKNFNLLCKFEEKQSFSNLINILPENKS